MKSTQIPVSEHLTYPVSHFITDSKEHQHIVTLGDAHCIEVTEDISTCYPALGREQRCEKAQPGISHLYKQRWSRRSSGFRDLGAFQEGRAAPRLRLAAGHPHLTVQSPTPRLLSPEQNKEFTFFPTLNFRALAEDRVGYQEEKQLASVCVGETREQDAYSRSPKGELSRPQGRVASAGYRTEDGFYVVGLRNWCSFFVKL